MTYSSIYMALYAGGQSLMRYGHNLCAYDVPHLVDVIQHSDVGFVVFSSAPVEARLR